MNNEQIIKILEEVLEKLHSMDHVCMTSMAARKIVEAEDALELARKMLLLK